jgi:hypothetical protein
MHRITASPAEPGTYWFKSTISDQAVIVNVRQTDHGPMVWWHTAEFPVAKLEGEWRGPIYSIF